MTDNDANVFPDYLEAVVKRRVDDRGRVAIGAVPGVSPGTYIQAAVWQHSDDLVDTTYVSGVVDDRQRLDLVDIDINDGGRVTVAVLQIGGDGQ